MLAGDLPFFLFSANAKLEEVFSFSQDSTRTLNSDAVEPTAQITGFAYRTAVENNPSPGTATGELGYSIDAATKTEREFEMRMDTDISYEHSIWCHPQTRMLADKCNFGIGAGGVMTDHFVSEPVHAIFGYT